MRAYNNELVSMEALRRRIDEIEEMRNNYESEYEYFTENIDNIDFVHTNYNEPVKKDVLVIGDADGEFSL